MKHNCLNRILWNHSILFILILGILASVPGIGYSIAVLAEDEEDDEWEEEVEMPSTKEVFRFLEEKFPEAHRELILARDEDPVEEFQAALTRAAEFVFEYREIAVDNPKGAEYFLKIERKQLEALSIADRYHESDEGSERQQIKGKLREAAIQLFELQIEEHEHELAILRSEIKGLDEMISERKANRDDEIKEILNELLELDD